MLRQAAGGGTALVVVTPHGDNRATWSEIRELQRLLAELKDNMQKEGTPLQLVLGMEVPLTMDAAEDVAKGTALTINGSNYVLVELPFQQLPLYWEQALFQLQLKGLRPILAHPERQNDIQANPHLISGVVDRGVLTQVTAGSLAGSFGPKVKKAAETLLKRRLVHVIASDCHRSEGPRSPEMAAGFQAAVKLVGEELLAQMAIETPMAIVLGMGTFAVGSNGKSPHRKLAARCTSLSWPER